MGELGGGGGVKEALGKGGKRVGVRGGGEGGKGERKETREEVR